MNDVPFEDGDTFIDCGASIGELHFWFRLNEININYIGSNRLLLNLAALNATYLLRPFLIKVFGMKMEKFHFLFLLQVVTRLLLNPINLLKL